jgi:tetratricopeptide (TPR) repeat protein
MSFKNKFAAVAAAGLMLSFAAFSQKARPAASASSVALRSITVSTEPNAIVWVDDVKRGVTDTTGKLSGVKLGEASKVLRVRAAGFKQALVNLTPASRGVVKVTLDVTGDDAELLYQKAEALREKPGVTEDERKTAIDLYEKALRGRPKFAEAYLGLARVYFDLQDVDSAQQMVVKGRSIRPIYPELSAVEGRIYHSDFDEDNAVKAYNRAVKEGRGYQPEAHTGLGIIYQEQEKYPEAIKEFKLAIGQLFGTEPILYQLLGELYEKQQNPKEAIRVYEEYLKLVKTGPDAIAVQSMVDQLKKELAGNGQP